MSEQGAGRHPQPAAPHDEHTRRQVGGAHHQGFKIDLMGERHALLKSREE